RFQLTSDSARIKFRSVEKTNEQTFPDFAFNLRTHMNSWVKLAEVNTFDGLMDLFAMEHFMAKCPNHVKYWLQDKGPLNKIEAAALLAEEYVVRRRANQADASKVSGNKPKETNSSQSVPNAQSSQAKGNNGAKNGNQKSKPNDGQQQNGALSNPNPSDTN